MFRTVLAAFIGTLAVLAATPSEASSVRLKDIVEFEGIRDNPLVGYGLVVGLQGTGDTLNNSPFTQQSLEAMLERLGVNTRDQNINTENVAAVMVTADLPAFGRQGSRIDVVVNSMGDAESLLGGTLLVTPLIGADGEVYAVAQGPIIVGGFSATGNAQTVTKNIPTVGRISNGGIVERETGFELVHMNQMRLSLRNPDLTTAMRVEEAINGQLGKRISKAVDPTTVVLAIPEDRRLDMVGLLAEIEQVRVETDQIARIVIDEKAGVIVMGRDVRVDEIAIAQGNLTVTVTETPQVSQPNAFAAQGNTETVDRTAIQIDEGEDRKLTVLEQGVSLQQLVDGLNALGVGPRDMISILQTIKAAGALQAEIEVM
ncbi:flagellar basal body P-ring protein FlgI [Minwuia thermotolerans]|uniref:Flagellar P-ring protein n=1 Tax=Minwuia thermotolerans TaxID=2056226 RepID=A0A2M9FXS3_9PROT|nr:flagellar basal body P-ring protein FlgI [Minwuia thermotolerans]PJK28257.1 flagellar biosynthesis protein FlgA [Minwuia thermotolerans]